VELLGVSAADDRVKVITVHTEDKYPGCVKRFLAL